MSAPAAPPSIAALHGDSWRSRWFAIAVGGTGPDLAEWDIRAQVRAGADDTAPLFSWHVAGGNAADTDVDLSTAEATLRGGSKLTLPALRLRLRPRAWTGKPTRWSGFLEIELTQGAPENPEERYTIVRRRPFRVVPDLVP